MIKEYSNKVKFLSRGFTLIELLAVIAILGILATIAVLSITFSQYLQRYEEDICPASGEIIYVDGKVLCSLHTEIKKNKNGDDGIPYL